MTVLPHRTYNTTFLPSGLPNGGVRISPARPELRKVEPSLSFQVTAPGSRFFDVIVATDAGLFDPEQAHRRTDKNFRSSRQDFQGRPIEAEIGFYLVPRGFVRDVISVEPRPSRIYYVAVAYGDAQGGGAQFSVAPDRMAREAPSVAIAGDLNPMSLSKVLGMAVERLGAVDGRGRVAAGVALSADRDLPVEIGGLPLLRRDGATAAPHMASPLPKHWPAPAPAFQPAPAPAPPISPAPQGATLAPGPQSSTDFVDEDYLTAQKAPASRFRDLDRGGNERRSVGFDYDDGFGDAGPRAAGNGGVRAPIPPLDPSPAPVPPPAGGTPAPGAVSSPRTAVGMRNAADLVALIIAEGAGGRYDALCLDGGYRGRFGAASPYYQRAHDGLAMGPHQAGQDSGELGDLLAMMLAADPSAFAQVFGPDAASLVAVTTAQGPSGLEVEGGRSVRVQPVGGQDLWADAWVERFRTAARHPTFQRVMDAHVVTRRLNPMRPVAVAMGLTGARGMAMLTAAAVHLGIPGAVALARAAVNPIDTPARVGAALGALGFADHRAFQTANRIAISDQITDETHFALIAALRDLGADSPVDVADAEAAMDALVTTQGPGLLGDALLKLRVAESLTAFAAEV